MLVFVNAMGFINKNQQGQASITLNAKLAHTYANRDDIATDLQKLFPHGPNPSGYSILPPAQAHST